MGAGSDFCWASCDDPASEVPPGIEFVDAGDDAVEFLLQALVGADVEIAAQQGVQSVVEILLGFVDLARLMVGQSSLVFLFGPGDQIGDRVGNRGRSRRGSFGGLWFLSRSFLRLSYSGLWNRCRSWSGWRSRLKGGCASWRQKGNRLLRGLTGRSRQNQGGQHSGPDIEVGKSHISL